MIGFYRFVERPCGMGRSTIGMGLQATSVTGEVSRRCGRSWRSSQGSWCREWGSRAVGVVIVSCGQWRLSTSSASATGRARASGYVWACPGVVAVVVEEGEDEARSAATGTGDVCVCVPCASARVMVSSVDMDAVGTVVSVVSGRSAGVRV